MDVLEIRAMLLGEQYGLTQRDKEWLRALSLGVEVKQLSPSSYTAVKDRLAKVRELLGARSNAHAVAEAIRRGIIE